MLIALLTSPSETLGGVTVGAEFYENAYTYELERHPESTALTAQSRDKWRNLNVSANGQGPRDKSRTQKVMANPDAAAAPLVITQAHVSTTLVPVPQDASADTVMEDSSKCALDGKNALEFVFLDFLFKLLNSPGIETCVFQSFVCLFSSFSWQMDVIIVLVGPRKLPNSPYLGDTAEEAAITATYKVAEAENKSFVVAEAAKEAERVSKMEEDSDNSLQVYKDTFEKCSHGEIVLLMA
ncbi:single myb histone 4-like [Lycium barbarum]|uniref:single myb histone 4-like n=1 Tax=Lycium barbarum TaxID=112863 RepID=UPI00293EF068|nr:single myb histone 4-like [Lycium barbarum]